MTEQEIITRYFSRHSADAGVEIGIGDDGAVVRPPKSSRLVITSDTLNEGVHFDSRCQPGDLGHKALAVNLSDLAAMGATPLWASLNLSLADAEHVWLEGFSQGLFQLADRYGVRLIGGDVVRGPLSVSLYMVGFLKPGLMLTRSGARPGDLIYVSGTIGDAAMGVKLHDGIQHRKMAKADHEYFTLRLNRPEPKVNLGQEIVSCASAAIDLSDGLLSDLHQILLMSEVGAQIELDQIPLSKAMKRQRKTDKDWHLILTGGDDYELMFTVQPEHQDAIAVISEKAACAIHCIGRINQGKGIELSRSGQSFPLPDKLGFDHFS